MLKATLRSAVLLGLVAMSLPAYAEVQNIKVGGDTTLRGFWRKNLDLNRDDSTADRHQQFFMQTTGINVDADLTENVSAHIRVANERDWNTPDTGTTEAALWDIDLSQAYVTLKELFYSPLTLRVGSQPIVWGRGFVLGSALLPNIISQADDRHISIGANEFTDFTAFDAIRATLDLGGTAALDMPLTVDAVYIKLNENSIGISDDSNIVGVNVGTRLDEASSEFEAYFLNKRDSELDTSPATDNKGSVNIWGIRGSSKPVEGSNVWGELAYQHGRRNTDFGGERTQGERFSAWAANFGGEYTLSDVAMSPMFGLEWIFRSGKNKSAATTQNGAQTGWEPFAPGYFTTALREFQTQDSVTGFYPVDQAGVTSAATNQHELAIFGGADPIEDLHVSTRVAWFLAAVPILSQADNATTGSTKRHRFIGTEWDTIATYNYTDDVQFGILHAIFQPGSVFRVPNDDTAQELITWTKVTF